MSGGRDSGWSRTRWKKVNSEKNSQRKCPTEEVGWWEEPESGMEKKEVWGLADILLSQGLGGF